uniref:Uncharacterized protein n=1 Tax=Arundo donax TaxID=35708 RepID=A0A0A9AT95_ARUDO
MARSCPVSTQGCGVPREVCEGFDFTSAKEKIKSGNQYRLWSLGED